MLRTVRYAGLAASCLLAVGGWLGGALPHGNVSSTPVSVWRAPIVTILIIVLLWRHFRPRPRPTPPRPAEQPRLTSV